MAQRVALTHTQNVVLRAVARSLLAASLYWTGGTLLATRYLHHRRSLDLDFFTEDLPDDLAVADAFQTIRAATKARRVTHVRYPNRWQYFFSFPRGELKVELVYFPFPALARRPLHPSVRLRVDSLRDLAANKAHAAYERTEPRDVFDLYVILRRSGWSLQRVLRDVERKFGVALDLVHVVAKLHAGAELLPDLRPLAAGPLPDPPTIQAFFQRAANQNLRRLLTRSRT